MLFHVDSMVTPRLFVSRRKIERFHFHSLLLRFGFRIGSELFARRFRLITQFDRLANANHMHRQRLVHRLAFNGDLELLWRGDR